MTRDTLTTETLAKALIVWGAALYGSLQLQFLPIAEEHGICGAWGCGPPVSALLACHLGWLVSLAGPAWLAGRVLPTSWLIALARTGLILSVGGLIGVALHEALVWWPQANNWSRPYWLHRYFFELATLVDAPILQVLLISATTLICTPRRTLIRIRHPTTAPQMAERQVQV
uniref:Uncharacterized protein n=1 Tax=Schlesneria paludicola TaxID=360056 RepID=A0A7C2JYS1_9PLAN